MKKVFCHHCGYPSTHPFGIIIKDGICTGCITHQEKDIIDWDSRRELLKETINLYLSKKTKRTYDCVVPVVGDAEDYFVLKKVIDLNLKPLVVSVNDYFKNDIGWHNLHQLITFFDVDADFYNPDLVIYKELVKTSLRKFDHVLLPFLQLHTSYPVHVAKRKNIPLVIWGGNQAVEQVGKFSHLDSVEMSEWSRIEHDLFGNNIEKLIGNGAQVDERKLNFYNYPSVDSVGERAGLVGIYLSNYLRWDPLKQNEEAKKYNFIPELNVSSFDVYERAGSSIYYGLHDLLKMKRLGYRKIKDHLAREVRHGRVSVEELDSTYQSNYMNPVYIKDFFDWLGITSSGYEWFLKHRLGQFREIVSPTRINSKHIWVNDQISNICVGAEISSESYITMGKGI